MVVGSQVTPLVKTLPANARDTWDIASIPEWGRSPGEGNGNPLQYSCLGNPMDRRAWQPIVHGVAKSWAWLSAHTPPVQYAYVFVCRHVCMQIIYGVNLLLNLVSLSLLTGWPQIRHILAFKCNLKTWGNPSPLGLYINLNNLLKAISLLFTCRTMWWGR